MCPKGHRTLLPRHQLQVNEEQVGVPAHQGSGLWWDWVLSFSPKPCFLRVLRAARSLSFLPVHAPPLERTGKAARCPEQHQNRYIGPGGMQRGQTEAEVGAMDDSY